MKCEKTRRSPRTSKSPFKLNELKYNEPIILLSDPVSECDDNDINEFVCDGVNDDKNTVDTFTFTCTEVDADDIISAYCSDTEEEVNRDPNGDFAYFKLKNLYGGLLREWNGNSDDEDESSETESNRNNGQEPSRFQHIFDDPLLLQLEFMNMIEDHSRAMILEYVVKVLDYVRNIQLTTSNELIKERIIEFFKYINGCPDSNVRDDCEDLKNDLIALNSGISLQDFPQPGTILIDLVGERRQGLSLEEVSKLPRHKYSGPPQNNCCICMAEYETGDEMINLVKCSHEFHATCIGSWLNISNQCPMCRSVVYISE